MHSLNSYMWKGKRKYEYMVNMNINAIERKSRNMFSYINILIRFNWSKACNNPNRWSMTIFLSRNNPCAFPNDISNLQCNLEMHRGCSEEKRQLRQVTTILIVWFCIQYIIVSVGKPFEINWDCCVKNKLVTHQICG